MKKNQILLFKPFLNSNGHLTIAYKITKSKIYLCNYNKSFYTLINDDSNVEIKYKENDISPEQFFENYPESDLIRDSLLLYRAIKEEFFRTKESSIFDEQLLLLTIKI